MIDAMPAPAFSAKQVTKRLGSTKAVDSVDLEIKRGEAVAIIGANGAGKTTLLKLLAGLLKPTSGHVLVNGLTPREARATIGYCGHDSFLYPYLTVLENLNFYASLYRVGEADALAVLDELAISHKNNALAGTLSAGETQRVSLARALVHQPDYLILDEPTSALDAPAAASLGQICRQNGRTVLVATHDLHRAVEITDTSIVLVYGRRIEAN